MDADMGVKAKVSGYLEKKGKMKVMSSFKKYWFVLEDRLLLYYRSKDEYGSLSPCKGSINLGPNCNLKPCSSQVGVFQIETRANTITLRAESREDQNRWMHAIMSSLYQNNPNPSRLSHFRYSRDEISNIQDGGDKTESSTPSSADSNEPKLIKKFQKLGAHSYCPTTIEFPTKKKVTEKSLSYNLSESSLRSRSDYEVVIERKSLSASKLSIVDVEFDDFLVSNDIYGTRKPRFRSLSMEQLPSIIIEDGQYKGGPIYDRVEKNPMIFNDLYETTQNVYEEPLFDHNENVMDEEVEERKKKKTKKKPKECKDKSKESKEKPKESLIHRVLKRRSKKIKRHEEDNEEDNKKENIYEEMPIRVTSEPTDKDKIQILNELHHILEAKKTLVKTLKGDSNEKMEVNGLYDLIKQEGAQGPLLPPKHQPQLGHSPFHDVPKNIPVEQILPPKKKLGALKSVDQILDDLEAIEEPKPVGKVQRLVKRFSSDSMRQDQVVIRPKKGPDFKKNRYSDELTMLLNQLAEVTSAPLLTPGTTTSLVAPNLTDDELLKMLPIRRRRLSEPDYDIPRSHVSLTNLPRDATESPITATRFFGPVLTNENKGHRSPTPDWPNSITPDSLEADLDLKSQEQPPIRQQLSLDEDYSSHNYTKKEPRKQKSFELVQSRHDYIYAQPIKKKTNQLEKQQRLSDTGRINDMFIDSLEMSNETTTPF